MSKIISTFAPAMHFFEGTYYVLVIALFLMGVFSFFVPVRKDKRLNNYRISLCLIGASYIALGLYCLFKWNYPIQLFSTPFLFMSSLQAVLLGLSHINLVNPLRISRRFVFYCLAPWIILCLAYIVLVIFLPHVELSSYAVLRDNWYNPEVLLRLVWMALYVSSIVIYSVIFYREERKYRRKALDFFSEDTKIDLRLVRFSFTAALLVGCTTVAITCSLDRDICGWLNIVILVLYIIMGLLFVRYPSLFFEVSPVFSNDEKQTDKAEIGDWSTLRGHIIESRSYLKEGITLEQMARELGVSRNKLSALINGSEGVNFNTFVNTLRIGEAERLIKDNPNLALSEIAIMVGYSEPANFSRQFKKVKGVSPAEFRRENT